MILLLPKEKHNMTATALPQWLRWIGPAEVRRVLSWDGIVPAVSKALSAYSSGPDHAIQPLRSSITMPHNDGQVFVMPGYVKEEAALATKVLSLFQSNAALNLSTHLAIIILLDPDTGFPLALLDGESITEARTAAASAVATQLLVRKEVINGGAIVAILGAGVQARAHARVIHHCLKPKQVRVWSRRPEMAEALCEMLINEGIQSASFASVKEAVEGADVINTCTLSSIPILHGEWVKKGAHINCVGAPRPDWQELESALVRKCVVYADSRESAVNEAGDIIKSGAQVYAEIGEVINGTKPALREETTMFKSLGLAVEDAIAARLVYDKIVEEEHLHNV